MYMVDTNVVREAGAARCAQLIRLASTLMRMTLGEIMRGIALKQKSDPKAASHLKGWLRYSTATGWLRRSYVQA
ncbi:hypothetical protein EV286_11652 [Rhizobium sp. BK251]|nr:hypothetical protein EV286_11652 [Rhizobium sp. BK251]